MLAELPEPEKLIPAGVPLADQLYGGNPPLAVKLTEIEDPSG